MALTLESPFSGRCLPTDFLFFRRRRSPVPVEYSQVQGRTHHRPLGFDAFESAYRPSPEAVVLFDLPKARFEDPGALFARECVVGGWSRRRIAWTAPVCAGLRVPAFGIARALRPHGTVPAVTTKAFNPQPVFGGVAFMVEGPAFRTGDGAGFA